MKREITYIKGNKYSLLIRILLCIVLVWTPIFLMFPHVEPINIKACVLFACLYSITVLLAQGKLGKIYIALSMLVIEGVNICELGWVTMNGSVLFGDSLWVVFDTNKEETKGFFQLIPSATYWIVGSQAICSILFTDNKTEESHYSHSEYHFYFNHVRLFCDSFDAKEMPIRQLLP